MKIQFAHRTFKWSNEAPGKAAVHCVIVGFGREEVPKKRLFDYAEIDGPAHEVIARNINPYLVDAPDVVLRKRDSPLVGVSPMVYGSKPADGGNLILTNAERDALLAEEPSVGEFIRVFIGAKEFLHGNRRWCLWLKECPPEKLAAMPAVLARVERVRTFRKASKKAATNKDASKPMLFAEIRQSGSEYLVVPEVSSERRGFIPIGFEPASVIVSNLNYTVPNATRYEFGILSSTMHIAWVRAVCGRLKSDFRYSAQIVYNNFPWPQLALPSPAGGRGPGEDGHDKAPTSPGAARRPLPPVGEVNKHRAAIEACAQAVLDARAAHARSTLAHLYDPNTMPPNLARAHSALDRAVDAAYRADGGSRSYANDAERVAFLFRRYAKLTSLV